MRTEINADNYFLFNIGDTGHFFFRDIIERPEASGSSSAVIPSHGFVRVVLPSTFSTLGFSSSVGSYP